MKKPKKWMYLEGYSKCGCTFLAKFKNQLLGYCKKHGNSRKNYYKLKYDANITFDNCQSKKGRKK